MATEQTSTHAAAAPAATIPSIDIPEDARTGGRGELLFRIRTEAGTVDAEADGSFIRCRGTADALEAAGIVRKEWLPGAPGCNRTAQAVVFGASGATLRFGKGKPITDPFIRIRIYGKKFLVLIPPTAEQEARLDAAHDEWVRERERARTPAQEPAKQTAQVIDLAAWRARRQA